MMSLLMKFQVSNLKKKGKNILQKHLKYMTTTFLVENFWKNFFFLLKAILTGKNKKWNY